MLVEPTPAPELDLDAIESELAEIEAALDLLDGAAEEGAGA